VAFSYNVTSVGVTLIMPGTVVRPKQFIPFVLLSSVHSLGNRFPWGDVDTFMPLSSVHFRISPVIVTRDIPSLVWPKFPLDRFLIAVGLRVL
jgi:hypothetical protein